MRLLENSVNRRKQHGEFLCEKKLPVLVLFTALTGKLFEREANYFGSAHGMRNELHLSSEAAPGRSS